MTYLSFLPSTPSLSFAIYFMHDLRGQNDWHHEAFWREKISLVTSAAKDSLLKPESSTSTFPRVIEDGYFLDRRPEYPRELISVVKDQIIALEQQGLPATFVMLYDELWELWRNYPMEVSEPCDLRATRSSQV
jgi:hypothetical protein